MSGTLESALSLADGYLDKAGIWSDPWIKKNLDQLSVAGNLSTIDVSTSRVVDPDLTWLGPELFAFAYRNMIQNVFWIRIQICIRMRKMEDHKVSQTQYKIVYSIWFSSNSISYLHETKV